LAKNIAKVVGATSNEIITSAKEDVVVVVCLSVFLSDSNFPTDRHEIFREFGNGPMNK